MVGIVQTRYAEALFNLIRDKNKLDLVSKEVAFTKQVLEEQEELIKVLNHPQVNEEAKVNLVKGIFADKISQEVIGLMVLTIRKNREAMLNKIFDEFLKLVKKHNNIATAVITSAISLSDEHIQKIYAKLKQELNKEVEIKTNIDKNVIAGLKIQVDNTIFDRTINNKVEELKKAL